VTLNQVIEVFDHVARPGKRGVRNLRVVLAARAPGYVPPESALESLLLKVLRRGGLPRPVLQYPFPGRPPGEARVDAAYPSSHVLIEADGRRWHTRVDDFVRDRGRDNEVVALGWRVLRFTWEDLRHRPDRVCAVVRRAAFPDAA
jgi:very-short-patch-repair endonuclease